MWKLKCDRDTNSRRHFGIFYHGIEKRASFLLVLVGAPRKECSLEGQTLSQVTT
jgi:hypothetical protein